MNEEIEIIEEQTQEPATEIEGIVGQILLDEHVSPKGTLLYNEDGQ